MTMTTKNPERIHDIAELRRRADKLRLYGIVSRWDELCTEAWVPALIEIEEVERVRRSHQYRIDNAKIGEFKPIVDFD